MSDGLVTHHDAAPGSPLSRPRPKGFTLIEVLLVVALLGLLAALSYPGFANQLARGRRVDAEVLLLEAQQALQRHYGRGQTYAGLDLSAAGLGRAPRYARPGEQFYDIELELDDDGQGFRLQARLAEGRSDPACGDLLLSSDGRRSTSTGAGMECWR
jgi:type IV pilus assembly protein PilE